MVCLTEWTKSTKRRPVNGLLTATAQEHWHCLDEVYLCLLIFHFKQLAIGSTLQLTGSDGHFCCRHFFSSSFFSWVLADRKWFPSSGGASGCRLLPTLLSAHQSGTPVTCSARCLAAAAAPPPSDTAHFVSEDRVHEEQEGVAVHVGMQHDLINSLFL